MHDRPYPLDNLRVTAQNGDLSESVRVRRDPSGPYVELQDVVHAYRTLGGQADTRLYLPEVYPKAVEPDEILYLADRYIQVQSNSQQVIIGGKNVHFTHVELALLTTFAREPDTVLNREYLYTHAWRDVSPGDQISRTVDVHVKRIRDKFGGEPYSSPREGIIRTRTKAGYVDLRSMT